MQKQFPQNSLNPEVKTRKSIMVIFIKITLNLVEICKYINRCVELIISQSIKFNKQQTAQTATQFLEYTYYIIIDLLSI